jgi:hypothetical protein
VSSTGDPEFTSPVDAQELKEKLNAHKRANETSDDPASRTCDSIGRGSRPDSCFLLASTANSPRPDQNPNYHSQKNRKFTGYLDRGKHRELNELTGKWEVKLENEAPATGHKDRKTFPDGK